MVRLARLFTFPYFFEDHEDRALTSMGSQLGFMCTVPCSLSRFDTRSRWLPILWPTSKLPALYKNKGLEPKVFSPFSNVCYNAFNYAALQKNVTQ